jgi:hypothetical protein
MKLNLVPPLLFLGVAVHASIALGQSPNTFTSTGEMSTPRLGHTATLLTNGKVLVAGGMGPYFFMLPPAIFPVLASAELYDPSTGTFTPTGSMATSRFGHTATLLPSGKVLIVGGARDLSPNGDYQPVASGAELYDPSTGSFTGIGSLDDGDQLPSTTLLADGRVLIVGTNAHLYDPGTGGLSDPINDNGFGTYFNQKGTLLMNGKVLFAGYDDDEGDFWGPELFDSSTDIFTPTGNMRARRAQHTTTLLPNGTVLIAGRGWFGWSVGAAGGEFFYLTVNSAELYDPLAGTFSDTGNMATDREYGHTATLLNDGSVLVAGGLHIVHPPEPYVTVVLSSAEIYHPGVVVPASVLLSVSGDGRGQGAILHADRYELASSGNPAVAGDILAIYCIGLAYRSVIPPQVAIGGRLAKVLFFGNPPGYAALYQVNVQVPGGVVPGPAVPVRLSYLGRPSNEVTIGVR